MRWALTLVIVGGGLLRVVPIWFGLPYLNARPDEETAIGHAVAVLGGDLNPHFFHWPSLTFYLFAGVFTASSWIRDLFSLEPALTPAQRILIARGVVAAAGTVSVACLYRIGRRCGGPVVGVLAAAFLGVAILHVRESHFAMTDVLMTLLVIVSLDWLLEAVEIDRGEPEDPWRIARAFAVAGLSGGLATSTKYSAAAVLAAMAAAQLLLIWRHDRGRSWWRLTNWLPSITFMGSFVASFVIATPYALLDFHQFAEGFQFNLTHLAEGHVGDFGSGWTYHLLRSLPFGVGVLTCLAALIGLVPLVRHHHKEALVLGAFAAALYISIGRGRTVFFRYALPLVPVICVFAAVGVIHAGSWVASLVRMSSSTAAYLLAALVVIPSAVNCVWFDALLARTDTRVLAANWLSANTQPTQSLAQAPDLYAQLDPGPIHQWYFDNTTGGFVNAGTRIPDWLVLYESPLWTYAQSPSSLRRLAAEQYELAYVSRGTKGARSAVYDMQDAFFMPVSGFTTVDRPGPTVLVYRRVR